MWAYSIAAAHLGLHHTHLDQYMISTWNHHRGEKGQAFPWLDCWWNSPLKCTSPRAPTGCKTPTFIHLASNFKAPESKEWMFHKGHVPADILDCDVPLIVESPQDLWDISETVNRKQCAWVVCHTVSMLNKVVLMYKEKFCPKPFEKRKIVRLIQSKTQDRHCSQRRH